MIRIRFIKHAKLFNPGAFSEIEFFKEFGKGKACTMSLIRIPHKIFMSIDKAVKRL
jgi:hypothetical protein